MLLGYAQAGDPGAYIMVGGVFLMLPFAVLALIVALSREHSGYYDRAPAPSRELAPVPERRSLAPVPDVQQTALGAQWTQPRLVARETVTTVRELFDPQESGALWPQIERGHG